MTFCKILLRVNKRATHDGILGELGRYPLYLQAIKRLFDYFVRAKFSVFNSLVNVAYRESLMLHNRGNITWFSNIVRLMDRTDTLDFLPTMTVDNAKLVGNMIQEKLKDRFQNFWTMRMTQPKRNENPKLRTYAQFKNVFDFEPSRNSKRH